MNYSNQRNQLNQKLGQVQSSQDYYSKYFSYDHLTKLTALEGKFIYHLYNELSGLSTVHDLNILLAKVYRTVDEYAKDCVQIAYKSSDIYGLKIKNWTDSALKAFDWFLIKLINDVLKEEVKKQKGKVYETDVYEHLISKKDGLYDIGIAFQSIYQQRNEFTHVQIEEKDGVRIPKPWSNKKYKKAKDLILYQFKKALVSFESELTNHGI